MPEQKEPHYLIREAEARAAEAHVLRTVAEALNSAAGLQEALDGSLVAVMGLIGSEAGWIALLEEVAGVRLVAARNLPPALEADGRAAMRGPCRCLDLLLRGHLSAAANIVECERLRAARGDTRGLRHHASVPIRVAGREVGILNLSTPADRVFTEHELNLLTAVGDQIGVAIERARLYEQVKAHHIEEQATLLKFSQGLLGAIGAQAVMDLAVRVTAEALKVEFVAVALIDAEGASVSARASLGWPSEILPHLQHVPREATPALTHAILTQVSVVIPDESLDTHFKPPPWVEQMGITASLVAPMLTARKAIGGLVVNSRTARHWSDDEVRLLSLIANDTTQALERARLFAEAQQRIEEQAALLHLSQALLGEIGSEAMMARSIAMVADVFRPDLCKILLLDEAGERLRLCAGIGWQPGQVGQATVPTGTDSQAGYTLASKQAIMVEDFSRETRFRPPSLLIDHAVASGMSAPMLASGRAIGVLGVHWRQPRQFSDNESRLLSLIANTTAQALERAQLYEIEREQRELAEALRDALGAGAALSATLDFEALLDRLLEQLARVVPYNSANIMLLDTSTGRIHVARQRGYEQFGEHVARDIAALSFNIASTANLRRMVETGQPMIVPDTAAYPGWVKVEASAHVRSWAGAPIVVEGQTIAFFSLDKVEPNFYRPEHGQRLAAFAGQAALALQNARLFEETRRRATELEALAHVSSALRQAQTREAMLPLLVEKTMQLLYADAGTLLLLEDDALVFAAARGPGEALVGQTHPPGDDPLWQVARSGEPLFIPDATQQSQFDQWEVCRVLMAGQKACACIPLKTAEATIGLLHLTFRSPRAAAESEIRLLTSIAEMAGNALHRATLHEQTAQRLQRLAILRAIDMAISASLDLHLTLNVLLDQVITQLRLDAADVLLFNAQTQTLEYAVGRGFRGSAISRTRARLGEGHAGRAALERRIVHVSNLPQAKPAGLRTRLLASEEALVAYYAVPLIAKGEVEGVLEIYHRTPLNPDREWLDFLEALAVQAAIAIDNAALYNNLQRSNVELALAYDTTIEGWSKALDLRDKETEGHTRRVTEITIRLACVMGIAEAELVHVRRGALLHDIGKMGVPDSILLKPGPLTEEEWEIMRKHPQYAYDMLSPIAYLRPALNIPYCHHEKWDGTGYPRGLKGEDIPLAARIFAVVDVWDALRSDRSYRAAWSEEKAREHIYGQAGKHFDPQVAKAFLEMDV